jgi:hypothetical protein
VKNATAVQLMAMANAIEAIAAAPRFTCHGNFQCQPTDGPNRPDSLHRVHGHRKTGMR